METFTRIAAVVLLFLMSLSAGYAVTYGHIPEAIFILFSLVAIIYVSDDVCE